jgi:Domain of unknown function (DUF4062)
LCAFSPMEILILFTLDFLSLAIAVGYGLFTVINVKNSSATYNARLLPFAYYSLLFWTFWAVQYALGFLAYLISRDPYDNLHLTIEWMDSAGTVFLVAALLSVYVKNVPRLSLILPYIIIFFLITAFIVYWVLQPSTSLSSDYHSVSLLVSAVLFFSFVPLIRELRMGKLAVTLFVLYGLFQLILIFYLFLLVSFETMLIIQLLLLIFRTALLAVWIRMMAKVLQRAKTSFKDALEQIQSIQLLPNFMPSLGVMISSTVEDLSQERDAVDRAVRTLHLDRFRAETFGSFPHTPRKICEFMAQQCDLFILLVGQRYGYVIKQEDISVVQFEYETARSQNPGKILVYVKENVEREPRLQEFLAKVQDFESGYFRSSFKTPEELYERIHKDIARWLVSRVKQKTAP